MFSSKKTSDVRAEPIDGGLEGPKRKVQHSIIGADVTITGDLVSTGDIKVDGRVDGNITCRTLTLGEQPVVNSSINADTVRICGEFNGDITAQKVVLTSTAKVRGDIEQGSLEIEPGAVLEGSVKRMAGAKGNGKINGSL